MPQVLRVTVNIGINGLGLQLADEGGVVVTRGFRRESAAHQAGVRLGDVLVEINGEACASFSSAIAKLKILGQGQNTFVFRQTKSSK